MVAGDGVVHGMLHDAGSVDLEGLDAFEGADYARTPTRVVCDGDEIAAEAYLYTATTEGLERIADGDFARWLGASGRQPIGH